MNLAHGSYIIGLFACLLWYRDPTTIVKSPLTTLFFAYMCYIFVEIFIMIIYLVCNITYSANGYISSIIFDFLKNNNPAYYGFIVGIVWIICSESRPVITIKYDNETTTITHPLLSFICCGFYVCIVSFMSVAISESLPKDFKWILPMSLVISGAYYIWLEIYKLFLFRKFD